MSLIERVPPVRIGGDRCPGSLRLHEAADGLLARVRVPGGLLTPDQVIALADAAVTLGDGALSLTARGNVEIRGLRGDDASVRLARLLGAEGLLPSAAHERIRNVVASPAAGLDGAGHAGSLVDVVRELDVLLCATPRTSRLSGRFLFGLDDGRGDMLGLQPDLSARWVSPDLADLCIGEAPALRLPASAVVEALVTASLAFLDGRDAADDTAWRIADLDSPDTVVAAILREVRALVPAARPVVGPDRLDHPAPLRPGELGHSAAHLVLRLGSAPATTWIALASLARSGDGLVRTTPGRGLILAGLDPQVRADLLAEAPDAGLIADPADPLYGVTACTGLPGCASARADVRGDVLRAVGAARLHGAGNRPDVHVSGCERRCGHPRRPHHEAVARPATDLDHEAAEAGYATALVDGSPATGRPLPDGRASLADLLGARPRHTPDASPDLPTS